MPWQCRLVDDDPGADRKPGDMWFVPSMVGEYDYIYAPYLSAEYDRDWRGKRPPICVVLPSGLIFCIDNAYTGSGRIEGKAGWTVTGDAPNTTVSPSINAVGNYHGWLQNGVLSDDVEGRVFPRG